MRAIALISQPQSEVKRLMIHTAEDGVYLLGYYTIEDAPWSCRFPFVCVSIGLTIQKQVVVGVVYNPILNEVCDC